MEKTFNLFISHSWSYSNTYDGLIALLNKDSTFKYINYSVPKDDPIHTNGTSEQLYNAIKEQISHASVVIILAGVYASYSKWIKKEIEIAKTEFLVQKPIIAVEPWASENTSRTVKDAADEIVGWNSNTIIRAIRKLG